MKSLLENGNGAMYGAGKATYPTRKVLLERGLLELKRLYDIWTFIHTGSVQSLVFFKKKKKKKIASSRSGIGTLNQSFDYSAKSDGGEE